MAFMGRGSIEDSHLQIGDGPPIVRYHLKRPRQMPLTAPYLLLISWVVILAQAKFLIIAHRGSSGERPEETFGAYERAADVKADYLESDLCSTKDSQLVLIHDCELSDTTNIATLPQFKNRSAHSDYWNKTGYWTENFDLSEIKELRCVQRLPERPQGFNLLYSVLTLEEYLAFVWALSTEMGRGLGVYIETKVPEHFRKIGLPLEEHLAKALSKYTSEGGESSCKADINSCRVILQSFEQDSLTRLHKLLPSIPRVFLTRATDSSSSIIEKMEQIATFATGLGPSMTTLTPALISSAHKHNLVVHPYTLRKETQYLPAGQTFDQTLDQLCDLGVDGVFTDFPGLVAAHLDKTDLTSSYYNWALPICGAALFLLLVQTIVFTFIILKGRNQSQPQKKEEHMLLQ